MNSAGYKQVQPPKVVTAEMDLNNFGEAILRATEGLDNPKVWISIYIYTFSTVDVCVCLCTYISLVQLCVSAQ